MSRKRRPRHRRNSPREELYLFLRQRNISAWNIEQIRNLTQRCDESVRALADLVLEIARVKPGKRRRMQIIARMLYEQWEAAQWQIRFHVHGKSSCWCESGQSYWLCCADRDDAFAEQLAVEEAEREWALNPDSVPCWYPDGRVDHTTRSA